MRSIELLTDLKNIDFSWNGSGFSAHTEKNQTGFENKHNHTLFPFAAYPVAACPLARIMWHTFATFWYKLDNTRRARWPEDLLSPQRGIFEVYLGGWKSSSENCGCWVPEHAPGKKLDFMVVLTSSDTDCTFLPGRFFAKIQNVFF